MILAAQLCRTVGISDDPEKQSEMRKLYPGVLV
jgi:hypothetical protein